MNVDRRNAMKMMAAAGTGLAATQFVHADEPQDAHSHGPTAAIARRRIPKTGELLPIIGLGTSRTFDADPAGEISPLVDVMRAFLDAGGTLVDSSPMYRRAETIVGTLLNRLDRHDLFFATKVWTKDGREAGVKQMNESITKMAAPVMDLMQVHNLLAWETHLPTLREWKEAGTIRYIGITEMRNYELTEKIMREENIDFIQIPYSIGDRRVEERILPAAADTGTAVLVMRPFEAGRLFKRVADKALPEWAAEFDCTSWAQFFLKFVLAHPAVTCPIPATSKVHHLIDNMQGGVGRVPDAAMRERMAALIEE